MDPSVWHHRIPTLTVVALSFGITGSIHWQRDSCRLASPDPNLGSASPAVWHRRIRTLAGQEPEAGMARGRDCHCKRSILAWARSYPVTMGRQYWHSPSSILTLSPRISGTGRNDSGRRKINPGRAFWQSAPGQSNPVTRAWQSVAALGHPAGAFGQSSKAVRDIGGGPRKSVGICSLSAGEEVESVSGCD